MDYQLALGNAMTRRWSEIAASAISSVQHLYTRLCQHENEASPSAYYSTFYSNSMLKGERDYPEFAKMTCLEILLAIDRRVLHALCKGDLLQKSELWDVLPEWPSPGAPPNPVIYAHYHVDKNEQPPSKTAYLAILGAMDGYLHDTSPLGVERQQAIDAIVARPPGFVSTERRYLPNANTVATLEEWLQAMRARLSLIIDAEAPIPRPVTEVGYTKSARNRMLQHQRHDTNALMNLLDAASRFLFGGLYVLDFVVLFECYKESHAQYAEHILSHICGAYVVDGGLNGVLGGRSVHSSGEIPSSTYTKNHARAFNEGPLKKQLAEEARKWKIWCAEEKRRKEIAELRAEIEALELEKQTGRAELERRKAATKELDDAAKERIESLVDRNVTYLRYLQEMEATNELGVEWAWLEAQEKSC